MSDPSTIRRPRTTQLILTGAITGAAIACWLTSIGTYVAVSHGRLPREMGAVLLGLAATATVLAGLQWHAYTIQRTAAHHHKKIVTAIGSLAAEMEQLSEKVGRIDPWSIYAAVAADLLEDRGRRN